MKKDAIIAKQFFRLAHESQYEYELEQLMVILGLILFKSFHAVKEDIS